MPRARKTTTPTATQATRPTQVSVEVMRRYAGGPDPGTRLKVALTPYVAKLMRAGFLKKVQASR